MRIATFVTPHGFGHAARAAAVMEALYRAREDVAFDLFTAVPQWFFDDSVTAPVERFELACDVGMVQLSPLVEDLGATIDRLDAFLPFDEDLVERLARQLRQRGVRAVLCDVAPLGLAVARAAGLPSVLIENFTWDWIYEGYVPQDRRIALHVAYLADQFRLADHHVQCEPRCLRSPADLVTAPVAREPRRLPAAVREALGIEPGVPLVLLSSGGVQGVYPWLETLQTQRDVVYVAPGIGDELERTGSLVRLPAHSGVYHPDLVRAADAVVGKLGYSTVSEVYRAGVPFAYVGRPRFREAPAMAAFVDRRMPSLALSTTSFEAGIWLERVPELLALPRGDVRESNGADEVARYVLEQVLDTAALPGAPLDPAYDAIEVGDTARYSRTVTAAMVDAFAEVSGDVNPVHVDEVFASTTRFGERIAHGMLAASLISTVVGTRLPGVNAIYLSQELRFVAPTRLGDTLTAEAEVLSKREDKPILTLRTTVTRADGTVVVEGEAVVMKDGRRS
jgi:acyl dehydratase